jgi:hypothetical protein
MGLSSKLTHVILSASEESQSAQFVPIWGVEILRWRSEWQTGRFQRVSQTFARGLLNKSLPSSVQTVQKPEIPVEVTEAKQPDLFC